ncbi:MAG: isocitrate lyase/PEP mutase family protein [Christensenellales bacterium]|jgi:2-methylisocitrate lyase-like PEP mutase family enzyme
MTISEKRAEFKKTMLSQKEMTVLCGAFDGITARLVQKIGFDGCYMGGQAAAASMLGVPDIGLVTATEQINHVRNLVSCVDMPYVMDADTGYGNALNVRRTLHDIEDAGVYGAHFEDQVTPKRCGEMSGVSVIPLSEYMKKIETLLTHRRDPNFLIIGRTDAASCVSIEEAIYRGNEMAAAGVDMVFYGHVIRSIDELKRLCGETKAPVLYCLMEFSLEVCFTLTELKNAGVSAVIWPNGLLMRWFKAAKDLMVSFKETGDARLHFDDLMDMHEVNELLGIREWNPPGMF